MADIRALANLCEARAKTATGFDIFRGNGPDLPTRNYAVLYFPSGAPYSTRLSGGQSDLAWSFRAMCVGLRKDDACLAVVDGLRELFRNWFPYPLDDSTSWFVEEDDGASITREDNTDPVRYSIPLRYSLTTRS